MWSHKHWTEGNNHLPHPAGYTLANTTHGLLCFKGKLFTDVQFVIKQGPQVFFSKATFYPVCPQPVLTVWVNSIPGVRLRIWLSFFPSWFLSCFGFFLNSCSASRLWATGKYGRNPEFPRERLRCDLLLLSQLCNQGILSHNMTILHTHKKCIPRNITSFKLFSYQHTAP